MGVPGDLRRFVQNQERLRLYRLVHLRRINFFPFPRIPNQGGGLGEGALGIILHGVSANSQNGGAALDGAGGRLMNHLGQQEHRFGHVTLLDRQRRATE